MNWFSRYLNSTLGRKVLVGLTGLGLVGFLAIHLLGNLLIYKGNEAYDHYATSIHTNPLLPVAEIGLLVFFLVHIALTIALKARSSAARPVGYDAGLATKRGKSKVSPSKTMIVSGVVVLLFLVLHMMDMRFALRLASNGNEGEAAHTLRVLRDAVSGPVYFVASLLVGYHVFHGFQSAFQSLGANHPKFSPLIDRVGVVFAVVVALGFASFPVYAFLTR